MEFERKSEYGAKEKLNIENLNLKRLLSERARVGIINSYESGVLLVIEMIVRDRKL